ncbi:hypothetical protein [Peribacillus sp. NPDC060253]|uniref:hypothetical protein n=1 Tax=Peribacillus sp. NPDC060253 TaxID=3347084 RepID=UPI003655ED36
MKKARNYQSLWSVQKKSTQVVFKGIFNPIDVIRRQPTAVSYLWKYSGHKSIGIIEQARFVLDLNYLKDSAALVDVIITKSGISEFVELQGTGEEADMYIQEMLSIA